MPCPRWSATSHGHKPAQFQPDRPEDEQPQDHDQRQIKAGEGGCIQTWEGKEQDAACGDQPDLIRIPKRADGAGDELLVLFAPAKKQVYNAGPEVVAIEDDRYTVSIVMRITNQNVSMALVLIVFGVPCRMIFPVSSKNSKPNSK
jgi:hypothetical protein